MCDMCDPPIMVILLGAARPYLMASAMASLGSENPSWAQRNGRINSSGNLLQKREEFTSYVVPVI